MLGAGGTGGHIAPHLYRLLHTLERPTKVIVCDGDCVEKKILFVKTLYPQTSEETKPRCWLNATQPLLGLKSLIFLSLLRMKKDSQNWLNPTSFKRARTHIGKKKVCLFLLAVLITTAAANYAIRYLRLPITWSILTAATVSLAAK